MDQCRGNAGSNGRAVKRQTQKSGKTTGGVGVNMNCEHARLTNDAYCDFACRAGRVRRLG